MFYQKQFQGHETPSRTHLSCYHYKTGAGSSYPMHCHVYYEVSYVISGRRYEFYNGCRYEVGDGTLFFIPPLTVHANENITEVEDIVLQFSPEFISSLFEYIKPEMMLSPVSHDAPYLTIDKSDPLIHILEQLMDSSDKYLAELRKNNFTITDAQPLAILEYKRAAGVFQLMADLLRCGYLHMSAECIDNAKIVELDKIINHILNNPDKRLSMEDAARMAGMGYYSFSRFFKEATGFSFSEYCNFLRIHRAEELLLTTDKSVTEIAGAIGIDTPSYFTRLFKKVNGSSPVDFREKQKKRK